MAKKFIFPRVVALIKLHPIKSATAILGLFAVIPGGITGVNYAWSLSEPVLIAQHYWVRDHTAEKLSPVLKTQAEHRNELDYLILKEQRKALSEAKEDLKRDPQSGSALQVIDRIQKSIDVRQKRLDDALKRN